LAAGAANGALVRMIRILLPALLVGPLLAQTWTLVPTAADPGDRVDAAAAFDLANNRTVLFGGDLVGGTFPTDTWLYDGANWSVATPTTAPPGRRRHAMAYDLARGRVVMFGGFGGGVLADTWEWDGFDWTLRAPATVPPGRYAHSMAYDAARGVTVMFGGTTSDIQPRTKTDTWEWNGIDWTQVTTANAPSEAEDTSMCYDIARGVCVLAGGTSFFGAPDQSTWEYDGVNWTNVTGVVGPGPTATPGLGVSDAQMVYDPICNVCVLHGGRTPNGTFPTETWHYDGTAWTLVSSSGPASRTRFVMAMDIVRSVAVLYGGINGPFTVRYRDTWEFQACTPASYATFGSGCPSSVGVATNVATALPRIGQTMAVTIGNMPTPEGALLLIGTSNTTSAFGPLPIDLALLGAPGCLGRVSVDALQLFALGSAGAVGFGVAIPNDPFFVGLPIYTQALVFETGINALGIVVSDAAAAVIGS
jgi:Galactose oxidase, central domain